MLATLFLASIAVSVPIGRTGPYVFVDDVHVNGAGPFRFLVDIGAQSSAVSERVAARLQLQPEARVEQVTAAGSRIVAATRAWARLGTVRAEIELLIGGLERVRSLDPAIDGVLGNNFFLGRSFEVDYERRVLTFNAAAPAGEHVALKIVDGRFVASVEVDRRVSNLVLDSGAPVLILFTNHVSAATTLVATNTGVAAAGMENVAIQLQGARPRQTRAVVMRRSDGVDGLLPLHVFRSVFVDSSGGYAVFK